MSDPGESHKVLIVDDTPPNIDVLRRLLEPQGYRISAALNGEVALKVISRSLPDLILMDVMMPGMDGYETTRRLKQMDGTREIPIIFITAKGQTEDIVQGFEVGGADFITKPFRHEEVLARIKTHLKIRELIKELSLEKMEKGHMAEIATSVLHNAINICNSLSISTEEISNILKNSKLKYLERAGTMLRDKKDALQAFMSSDPQGKDLLEFFERIGDILNLERGEIVKELTNFREKMTFVTQVISTQQEFSKGSRQPEQINISLMVDQMLEMQCAIIHIRDLEIEKDYRSNGSIMGYKSKLMQVFMNIIKNGLEAMVDSPGTRKLQVEIFEEDENVVILIRDQGRGIAKQNLSKLFTYGFTTKKEGHGFGLSHCRRIIEESNGKIEAASEGEGLGAEFRLTFPISD